MKNASRVQILLALVFGVACSAYCYSIYEAFPNRWDYLTWDPAAHGWDGMRLSIDILHLQPVKLLLDINSLVLWPPLHSLFETPFFLIFGMEFQAAVLCSLTFLALFFPSITWLYQQMESDIWPGWLLLIGLISTSPYFLGLSTMPMLEITGAALTCFSASLFLRKSKWFPLSLTLLFFVKYNYCIYVLLPALLMDLSKENYQMLWQSLRKMKLVLAMMILFVLFAATILLTGGVKIGSVSIRGIGNPAYFAFLILIAILLITRQYRPIWNSIKGTGWEWFVVPVFIWLVIPAPNRIKTLIAFSINRSLGGPAPTSIDYYSYYFGKLPLYFANYWITWVSVLSSALIAYFSRKDRRILFLFLLFTIPFLLMTLNQNKQDRFLFTFIPFLWVLTALAMNKIPWRIPRYAAMAAFLLIVILNFPAEQIREHVRTQFAPLRVQPIINFIVRRIGDAPEVRILGTTNDINPASIQYHSAAESGFRKTQHFDWEIEKKNLTAEVQIICINCEIPQKLVKSRDFPDGTTVRHYILDTPEAAPYNPNQ